jgi:hypothetical protein
MAAGPPPRSEPSRRSRATTRQDQVGWKKLAVVASAVRALRWLALVACSICDYCHSAILERRGHGVA